jgi:hypothetical protein
MSTTPSPASSVSSSSRPEVIPDDDTTFAFLPIRNVIFPPQTGRPSNTSRFLHAFFTNVVDNNVDIPSNLIRPLFGSLNAFNDNVIPVLPRPLQLQLHQSLFDGPEILSPSKATLFWHDLRRFLLSWTPPLPNPPDFGTTPPPHPISNRRPATNKRRHPASPSATLPSKRRRPTCPNTASPPTTTASRGLLARLTSTLSHTVSSICGYFRPQPSTRPVRRNPRRAVRRI